MESIRNIRRLLDQNLPDALVDRPDDEPADGGEYPSIVVWEGEQEVDAVGSPG